MCSLLLRFFFSPLLPEPSLKEFIFKLQITILRSWRASFTFSRHVHLWWFSFLFPVPHRLVHRSDDLRLSRQKQRDLTITFLVFTGRICMRRFLLSRVWGQPCCRRKLSQPPVTHSPIVFAESFQFTYYSGDHFHSFKRRAYKDGERRRKNARNAHAMLLEDNEWNEKKKKKNATKEKKVAWTGWSFQRQNKV